MYCPQCGTANTDSNSYCIKCGHQLTSSANPASNSLAATPIYADLWRRIVAYIVDYVVITLLVIVGVVLLGIVAGEPAAVGLLVVVIYLAIPWLYCALSESSSKQGTLGKVALSIKVTDYRGERITFAHATGRFFAKFLSSLTLGIGYVMAGFTARRQGLHDIVASTLVVQRDAEPALIERAPPAGSASGLAVAALVILAMVPLIGILAAIAIPAYQDYTIRAQVAEGLTIASDFKAGVAEAVASGLAFDEINSEELGLPVESDSRYVEKIEVIAGAISITYGKDANPKIDGRVLSLFPAVADNGDIHWNCGYARSPPGFTDVFEEHWQYSDVEEKHIPAACRESWNHTR